MPDKYQNIRDHKEIELAKKHTKLDRKLKRNLFRIYMGGLIIIVLWLCFCGLL